MRRPDDCSLTPGQRLRVRKEAERALREAGALDVFPTPIDRIMAVARVEEVKEDVLNPGFLAKLRAKVEEPVAEPEKPRRHRRHHRVRRYWR